ncbi:SRPBCC domain-containing protein [Nonomuraea angiospora]|uniref:SRPBCC family protein n=1 Tax=Nonomuraea angiospora TaxID=46172 RepID=UPI00344FA542
MVDIRHRVGIAAPRSRVFEALTTTGGLAAWWTRDVQGDPAPGGRLRFRFGSPDGGADMEVTDVVEGQRVEWRCVQGPEEWMATTVTFSVKEGEGETILVFTHDGWPEPAEFLHHCSTKWAHHLLGLKAGLEGGRATPYPDDLPISSWG